MVIDDPKPPRPQGHLFFHPHSLSHNIYFSSSLTFLQYLFFILTNFLTISIFHPISPFVNIKFFTLELALPIINPHFCTCAARSTAREFDFLRRRFVQMKKIDKFHIQEGVSAGTAADGTAAVGTAADGAATACIGPSGIATDGATENGATADSTAVSIVDGAAAASTIGKRSAHTIKKWAKEEMPRERFVSKGAESLSNAELLAIILRCGTREKNAIELAREILERSQDSLQQLRRFSLEEFSSIKGVGIGKALSIMAAFELSRRAETEVYEGLQILSSSDAARVIAPLLRDLQHEECWVIYLNRANRVIAKERHSSGGVAATVMDAKLIVRRALAKLASGLIIIHNHPSGNRLPGSEDKQMTRRLSKAAEVCDLVLVDHLIVAGNTYYSFRDEGGI